jgi:pimeloyl-ACP methyl ester carboxylesterase
MVSMEPVSRHIRGAHGLELHLLEWSGSGVPLLLLHGFGNDAHIWDAFAPAVAPYYRTLALDHRGHGDSGWDPESRYDHDTMVADVEALTHALGIDRLVLIGHSLGGRIATLFAARHASRMAGLVLVDIGPEVDPRGVLRIRSETAANADPVFASEQEYARLLSLHYPAARPETLLRMAHHGLRRLEDGTLRLKMDPALRGGSGGRESAEDAARRERESAAAQWQALAAIACPTLVVRGAASDVFAPDVADRMVEVLPRGALAVVPRAGHSVMTDNPEGFRDAVVGFVLEG